MSKGLSLALDGSDILLTLKLPGQAPSEVRLNLHEFGRIVFGYLEALEHHQENEGATLKDRPLLSGWPSFAVGNSGDGDPMIMFRVPGLPPLHFLFSEEAARTLTSELQTVLGEPTASRPTSHH